MTKSNRYLIDTQIFIWLMESNKRLASKHVALLKNPKINIYISIASVWEMVIKQSLGRLKIPVDLEGDIQKTGFRVLPIEIPHVLGLKNLPNFHKDPFDRMIIAQAKKERLILITSDEEIAKYKVPGTMLV